MGRPSGPWWRRTTRLVILARMDGTDARSAREGFTKTLRHVPALLQKTLPYDRGKEMAEHARLAERLAIRVFFAVPTARGTRHQRDHEGVAAPVLAQGHGLVGIHVARAERHRPSVEHAPEEMSRLCHATGSLCANAPSFTRCT